MAPLLAALALAAPLASAPPTSAADSVRVFTLERLSEGVWAALVVDRPDAYAFANSLVVVGDRGVLVVDTQQSPTAARALVRQVRALTDRPVRWVVNTHWHGDHVYGNIAYREAFPDVGFLAHPGTVEGMRGPGRAQREEELKTLPGSIAEREAWIADGALPDGRTLTPELESDVRRSIRLRSAYLDELRSLVPIVPETLVDGVTVLDIGGRTVTLRPLGPAHTDGDVVVSVPEVGVVAVGDLLEEGLPWIDGAASLAGWSRALDALAGQDAGIWLPSHGGIQRDRTLLEGHRALFADLVEGAGRAVGAGWTVDEWARRMPMEEHRAFFSGRGVDAAAFDRWLANARLAAVGELRAAVHRPTGG